MEYSRQVQLNTPADALEFLEHEQRTGRLTEAECGNKFSALMLRGITASMTRGHTEQAVVYPALTTEMMVDSESHTYVGVGTVSEPERIAKCEVIPQGEISTDRATLTNQKYALAITFCREDLRRDRTGILEQRARQLGASFAKRKDRDLVALFNDGTTTAIYDGDNFFDDQHPNFTGSGANTANDNESIGGGALSAANLEAALQVMAGWADYNGDQLDITPRLLVVASNQLQEAQRLMASAAQVADNRSSGVTNVLRGIMDIVHWPRLTASTWYIGTDVPGLIYQVEEALRVEREAANSGDVFWRDLSGAWKGVEWRTFGVTDWRSYAKGN
jgi:phage major head subunit gpT-like protein